MIAQSFEITVHISKVNKLSDREFFIVGYVAQWLRV